MKCTQTWNYMTLDAGFNIITENKETKDSPPEVNYYKMYTC